MRSLYRLRYSPNRRSRSRQFELGTAVGNPTREGPYRLPDNCNMARGVSLKVGLKSLLQPWRLREKGRGTCPYAQPRCA